MVWCGVAPGVLSPGRGGAENHPRRESVVAHVIVKTDDSRVLMDEEVQPLHLDDDHSAVQLLERLAWAIEDAHGQERQRRRQRRPREIVRRQEAFDPVRVGELVR